MEKKSRGLQRKKKILRKSQDSVAADSEGSSLLRRGEGEAPVKSKKSRFVCSDGVGPRRKLWERQRTSGEGGFEGDCLD